MVCWSCQIWGEPVTNSKLKLQVGSISTATKIHQGNKVLSPAQTLRPSLPDQGPATRPCIAYTCSWKLFINRGTHGASRTPLVPNAWHELACLGVGAWEGNSRRRGAAWWGMDGQLKGRRSWELGIGDGQTVAGHDQLWRGRAREGELGRWGVGVADLYPACTLRAGA